MLVDDLAVGYVQTGLAEASIRTLGISPNPATDQLRITGLGAGFPATVKVFSSTGRLERMANLVNGTLSVEDLPAGAYILQVDQAGQRYQAPLMIAR